MMKFSLLSYAEKTKGGCWRKTNIQGNLLTEKKAKETPLLTWPKERGEEMLPV